MAKKSGENRTGSFPWEKLAKIKAQVLQTPFSELDETISELSQNIISIDRIESEGIGDTESTGEREAYEENNSDDWDPETEYGIEELDEDETQSSKEEELEIEKDFESGIQTPPAEPELIIIPKSGGFIVKTNTYNVLSQWGLKKTGKKHLDNAGIAVIGTLRFRAEVLEKIGEYFINKLHDYLKNINNPDRYWFRKPLIMSEILGEKVKSTVSRVINKTQVLLPSGEIEDLKEFFEKTKMPVSSKCIANEIGKIMVRNRNITNKKISKCIETKAKEYNYSIKLTDRMISIWRKKYELT